MTPEVSSEARAESNNVWSHRGFTLIEIAIVLMLIGLLFSFVVPRFRARTDADLKRTSLRLAATIEHVFYQSVFRRETYRLHYDLEGGRYWVDRFVDPTAAQPVPVQGEEEGAPAEEEPEDAAASDDPDAFGAAKPHYVVDRRVIPEPVRFPQGVLITDVTTQYLDTISEGKAFTHFFPDGYAEPTVIHLADRNKREYTLVVSPLSGKVKVIPRREEFEVDMKDEQP